MKKDVVGEWLDSFGRRPLLPKGETLRLTKIIQDPQAPLLQKRQAQDTLVRAHVLFVAGLTQKYLGRRAYFNTYSDDRVLDYLQAALEGLLVAAEKFDPQRGAFTTCASQWIRSRLGKHHLRHGQSVIHVPENVLSGVFNNHERAGSEFNRFCAKRALSLDSLDRPVYDDEGRITTRGQVGVLKPVSGVV